jgi:tRNA(Ile)-lysidine synthase
VLKKLSDIIAEKNLFSKKDKLLLACSAGCDSTVLAHVLHELKYNFSIAHVNFKLRGKESELDEKFCRELAKEFGIKFFSVALPAKELAKKKKISIQMAARELRYDWLEGLMKKEEIDKLITAHHLNDTIETFFLHLTRGSGVNGLKGMEWKRGKIIRPMLSISRKEIEGFAGKNKIKFRTDKSNLEDKYERNFIRHHIVPKFKKLDPGFEKVMSNNLDILKEENEMLKELLTAQRKKLVKENANGISINKNKLRGLEYKKSFLRFVLAEHGFNASQLISITKNIENKGESGKKFTSATHILAIDREAIQVKKNQKAEKSFVFKSEEELKSSGKMRYETVKKFSVPKKNELLLNKSQVHFPFTLRDWRTGDRFVPFGMEGSKLLSDFLKDNKVPTLERKEIKVLENGKGDIIWVVGMRSDERYRVGQKGEKLIKLAYIG